MNYFKKIRKKHIIHFVSGVIILVVFLMQLYPKRVRTCFPIIKKMNYDNSYLLTLIPFVMTIISIGLTLTNEVYYGLTFRELRELKKEHNYSMKFMIILSVILLNSSFIFTLFNLKYLLVGVSIISTIYMIAFIIIEVPLLARDEYAIFKIIRNYNYQTQMSFLENEPKHDQNSYKLLMEYTKENGIKAIIDFDKNSLDDKINLAVGSLKSIRYIMSSQAGIDKENIKMEKFTVDEIKMISRSIDYILSTYFLRDILLIEKNYELKANINRILFDFLKLLEKTEFEELAIREFKDVFGTILLRIYKEEDASEIKKLYYYLLNEALISAASSNESNLFVMFLKSIFNNQIIIYEKYYLVFFSLLLFYLIELENDVDVEFKKELEMLVDKSFDYLGMKTIPLKVSIKRYFLYLKLDEMLLLLNELLLIVSQVDKFWGFYRKPSLGLHSKKINADKTLSERLIINWWLHILTKSENWYKKDVEEIFKHIKKNLSEWQFEDMGAQLIKLKTNGLKLENDIGLKYSIMYNLFPREKPYDWLTIRLDELIKVFEEDLLERHSAEVSEKQFSHNQNKDIETFVLNEIKNSFQSISLEREVICIEEKNKMNYLITTKINEEDSLKDILKSYLITLPEQVLNRELISKVQVIDKEEFNEDLINTLYSNYDSFSRYVYFNSDKFNILNSKNMHDYITTDEYFLYNENAIKFGLYINEHLIKFRPLTKIEIEEVIIKEFEIENGLYRYFVYGRESVELKIDKEKISDLIRKTYRKLEFSLHFEVFIEKDQFLRLKINRDED